MAEIGVPIFDDLVVFVGKDPLFDRHFGTITRHESPAVAAMLDEKPELEQGECFARSRVNFTEKNRSNSGVLIFRYDDPAKCLAPLLLGHKKSSEN